MNLTSEFAAAKIRELSLKLVHKAKASHIGSALSIADVLAVLITTPKICDLREPKDPCRDRLLLSKGHACVALYSALSLRGYFDQSSLMTYGDDYSPFMNHVSHYVPGVEVSTGALGHAMPIACGMALAAKSRMQPWHTFTILSDGELQEGSNWESFMFAAHHGLDNLTVIIDNNNLQSLESVDSTLSLRPLDEKLRAFGLDVYTVNGHNHDELKNVLTCARKSSKPAALIMLTTKGKGVSFMENSVEWHYKSPNDNELQNALREVVLP